MNAPIPIIPPYKHTPLFPLGKDTTTYRKISVRRRAGRDRHGPRSAGGGARGAAALSEAAFMDINHLLRPAHLASLKSIVEDPEASDNDKFVAFDFLKNANIAAGGVLPMCQDTGTAIIMGKKGRLGLHRWRRRGGARRRRARRLSEKEPALFAARAALYVRGEEHREQRATYADRNTRGEPWRLLLIDRLNAATF